MKEWKEKDILVKNTQDIVQDSLFMWGLWGAVMSIKNRQLCLKQQKCE